MAKKTDDKTDKAGIAPTVADTSAAPTAAPAEDVHEGASEVEAVPEADETALAEQVSLRAPLHDPRDAPIERAPAKAAITATSGDTDLAAPTHDPRTMDESDAATFGAERDSDSETDAADAAPVMASSIPSSKAKPAANKAKSAAEPAAERVVERVVVKRGGFFPALLGGVIAAGLGFGLALALYPDGAPFMSGGGTADLRTKVEEQSAALAQNTRTIAELQSRVTAEPDLSGLESLGSDLAALKSSVADVSSATDQNAASLSNLTSRLTAIEKRPVETGVSDQAIKAYEGELTKLQQAMQDQRSEIEDMIAQSQEMKADAANTARETQIRASLVRIGSSLDAGDPYEAPIQTLADLGIEIPAPLDSHAAAGVATMARLRDEFPEYARKALAVTRDNGDTSSVVSFLKNQLGARSLNPREGNDPDAILSRAEGKLRDGQLSEALDELSALPDTAKSEIQPWIDLASGRAEAVTAQEAMMADFKTN
ncbi:COG4223 family protein [Pseudooceanicola spongiae]|uniref:Mitochondrial inner membrane protein n=1 Tax=Pseudooceanicola spongiae TaxID=2613965 RepID=A0A7L9WP33_9RHOB|nr:hypothetical protein [Pseudooceanicola spongiae]QOL82009.1 hypothetical protein F3W81_14945 [Pseudooceanicola spongiae]